MASSRSTERPPLKVDPIEPPIQTFDLPLRTPPDEHGKPKFFIGGDDGPQHKANEIRRHVYRRDGTPVRIKIKFRDGEHSRFANWYRAREASGATGWQAAKPADYVDVPYVGAIQPFDRELALDEIYWPEGEKDVDILGRHGVPAFTFGGVSDQPACAIEYVSRRKIVILADNDEPGRKHAEQKAALCNGIAASVRVVHFPDLPSKGDVSDWFGLGHTAEDLTAVADATPLWNPPPVEVAGKSDPQARSLVLNRLSDVEMRAVDWYWRARLAAGKHTALAGDPGAGKSSVTIAIAAAFTTGGGWPCGEGRAPVGNVIVLSAEDGEADTIKPRLVAAGGDPSRVYVVSATKDGEGQRTFNLQADLDLLERAIDKIGDVLLVIIDPVSSYLGKVDGHKNSEVRGVLEPLSEMAARLGVAILSVTHFSKDGSGKSAKAFHRFVGSIAFIGAPRMAFTVMPDPEDATRSLFLHVKNNLAAPPKGLAFRKEQREAAPGIIASAIVWESSYIETTADETLTANDGGGGRSAKEDAADFLDDLLGRGPIDLLDVEEQARAAGLLGDGQRLRQNKAFRAARKSLGVLFERDGFGKGARYVLRLSNAPCAPSNAMRALSPDGAHMGVEGAHEVQEADR